MDSQCPSGSAPPEPSGASFLGFPMPFRLTKTAVCDYAELAGVTEAEAITELERRAVDATKVREQENGLALYRLKGSHRGNRYRLLVAPDGAITRVLPEHSGNRMGG